MIEGLIAIYRNLVRNTNYKTYRYLYKQFHIKDKLTGLVGPRGTGKTTLLLQFIKEKIKDKDECIYISLDNIYFSTNLLFDTVRKCYEEYGIRYFFLDEVHKYKTWNRELKNIYDSYPDIKVVFSGSSSIDLIKGSYDLSRRGTLFYLGGMSFREYLYFKNIAEIEVFSFEEILKDRAMLEEKVASIKRLKGHFKDYLKFGFYPFFMEDREGYYGKLFRIVEKTVFEDISNFYKLKTENLWYFKKILSYLATIPPGELNRNSIAKNIGLDNKTVNHYLNILSETGLALLISSGKKGSALLKSREKIMLDNPNLYYAIADAIVKCPDMGTVREIFFVKMLKNAGIDVFFSKTGDYEAEGYVFEIGGKSKGKRQLKGNRENSFVVKDDILYGGKREIPLYLFGFLY